MFGCVHVIRLIESVKINEKKLVLFSAPFVNFYFSSLPFFHCNLESTGLHSPWPQQTRSQRQRIVNERAVFVHFLIVFIAVPCSACRCHVSVSVITLFHSWLPVKCHRDSRLKQDLHVFGFLVNLTERVEEHRDAVSRLCSGGGLLLRGPYWR